MRRVLICIIPTPELRAWLRGDYELATVYHFPNPQCVGGIITSSEMCAITQMGHYGGGGGGVTVNDLTHAASWYFLWEHTCL